MLIRRIWNSGSAARRMSGWLRSNSCEGSKMTVQPDFRDLLALFSKHDVEYVIVGAYALAFHGVPRYTGDLDIYVRPNPRNAGRIVVALSDFGFGSLNLTPADFEKPENVVELGVPPVRVDLFTSISGVTWEEVDAGKVPGTFGDVSVHYLGREQIIANKRAVGRKRDLADLDALGEK